MKCSDFLISIIKSRSGFSSKRLAGCIGWITSLLIVLFCTFKDIEAPQITEYLFICSTSLLGIDSVTGAFTRRKDNNVNNQNLN